MLASISHQWGQKDPAAALAWAQGLSDSESRDAIVPGVISVVAEDNPSAAAEIVSRLSGDTQLLAGGSLVSQWAGADPQAASEWAGAFPPGELRDQLLANVMNRWVKNDPYAAATWLATLATDSSRDAAVGAFTSRLASIDPQTAVQWATTISDRAMRDSETEAAIQVWLEADPAKASAWIASSGLPDEIKARFLPPQS